MTTTAKPTAPVKQPGLLGTVFSALTSVVRETAVMAEATIGMGSDIAVTGRIHTTQMKLEAQLNSTSEIKRLEAELAALEV